MMTTNTEPEHLTVDYNQLMGYLSVPRPNGSSAERRTRHALLGWLDGCGIPHYTQDFCLYPYFFIAIGLWLIFSRSLLALAIWFRSGWPAFWIALVGLLGGLVDVAFNIPLVSWPGATRGENILIEFGPDAPDQEIVISAHYDSKTELLDHQQRLFFIKNLRLGIALTITLGLLGPLDGWLLIQDASWATLTFWLGVVLSLPLLFLAWGIGLNMSFGWLRAASQGAVDNGAACAILLGLSARLQQGNIELERTRLTLALFGGEEVNMQGSRAYASGRNWPLPALALNLEVMAQDGDYVFWEWEGTSMVLAPTNDQINRTISEVIESVRGVSARPAGPVTSDGYSFLRVGVPATTIGTYDRCWVDRGFHGSADNLDRVIMDRLPEAVEILARFIAHYDGEGSEFPQYNDGNQKRIYSYPKGERP